MVRVQPPQRTATIPLVLIIASLVGAIALPWIVERRLTRLWTEVSEVADPARTVVADIQAAVGLEMAGTRGFLITRDPSYRDVYTAARARRQQASNELIALTATLPGDAHDAAVRLGALLDTADTSVRDLFDDRVPAERFAAQLPAQQTRFQDAMNMAIEIDGHLRSTIADRRQEIRTVERLRVAGFLVVILIALGAAVSVASLGSQYRRAYEAERHARADSDTARRQVEAQHAELKEVTESRAALIRGFTHDVRNPIGAAAGDLQLLQKEIAGPLSEKQRASVNRAARALDASLTLIHDLLTLARAEAIEVSRTLADVRALAREVIDEHQAAAIAKALVLSADIAADVPLIATDAARVRQILGNLISNAVKYTAQGRIVVRVERRRRETELPEWIAVDVADTGPGIPPAEQELLFREFYRLRSTQATRGAGIGLAISKRLARALDGDLSVASEVGRGSVFTLWLPMRTG